MLGKKMELDKVIDKVIEDNPKIQEDFKKNKNSANRLIGEVRKLGCMIDPKLVKKEIYKKLGAEFKEKKEKENVNHKDPYWYFWKNVENGQKFKKDFGVMFDCPDQKNDKYNIEKYNWKVYYSELNSRKIGLYNMDWLEFLKTHKFVKHNKEFEIKPEEFIDNRFYNEKE